MERKGFPESYDLRRMLTFLKGVKTGAQRLQVPIYSHEAYDVVPGEFQTVDRPDILIFEGLNVLQTANRGVAVASDFFDFAIYLDAETGLPPPGGPS
jgi:type I pantothenate kinase